MGTASIRSAVSSESDTGRAVDEITAQLAATDSALTFLFVAPNHRQDILERKLANVPNLGTVIGCTSAGELTPRGYLNGTMCAVSLPRRWFSAAVTSIEQLDRFRFSQASQAVNYLRAAMDPGFRHTPGSQMLAIMLVDGRSMVEERLCAALSAELGGIPLIGGTAGDEWRDNLDFSTIQSRVLVDGRFRENAAAIALLHSRLPFLARFHEHYRTSDNRGVITAAEPEKRLVHEINGRPAVPTYAAMCGLSDIDAGSSGFSSRPAVIRIGDQFYPRGILEVQANQSIRFACAVSQGMVFSIAEPGDLCSSLDRFFGEVRRQIGPPSVVLGFDCASRMSQMDQYQQRAQISSIMIRNHVTGSATFGEQFNSVHVNNSFTCVAFGQP